MPHDAGHGALAKHEAQAMSEWNDWIGREERRGDRVDGGHFGRWLATLDREGSGDGSVPQGFHFCLCLPDAPTARLGPDGHPQRDESPSSFLPPVPLPRRMWASSKMEFHVPLRTGEQVERRSEVLSVTAKLAVREVQSLVYREPAPAGAPPAPPAPGEGRFDPAGWDAHRAIVPSETLLFRYSALTFNTHRIHYDLPYAMGEEGYRGLIVHGPLTATLLLDLAQRQLGDNALKTFAFRGLTPGVCGEELHLVMRGGGDAIELGAFASDGRHVMSAMASA
jgi:3-methylfumaryl-CoA hydratase